MDNTGSREQTAFTYGLILYIKKKKVRERLVMTAITKVMMGTNMLLGHCTL